MAAKKRAKSSAKGSPKRRKTAPPVLTQSTRPARSLFRLLPVTIFTATCLLGLKVVEIVQTGTEMSQAFFVGQVQAEQEAKAPEESHAKAEAAKPAEHGAEKSEDAHGAKEGEAAKVELPKGASTEPPAPTPAGEGMDVPNAQQNYNKRELDVLENLSDRRQKIEQMERDVDLRAKVLEAAEQRIDEKLAELKRLSGEVKGMLVVQSKEEETKITSLVKIYEAMKPKDAARIFDEMDMDVLLLVVGRMNERRIAPVLAAMSPEKAKDVTQELAAQQKMNREKLAETKEQVNSPPL